jgi:kumamolisin
VKFKRPRWQDVRVASLNPGSIDGRVVPDVAGLAGPPGYSLVFRGKAAFNGGTSATAPLWASLVARIAAARGAAGAPGFLTPLLYEVGVHGSSRGRSAFSDIRRGKNTSPQPGFGYRARAGFDAVSGWGVPNGKRLLESL